MMTQGFATPGTPEFCTMSETTICTEYESKYSCCCQDAISEWQNCIAQQELSPLMNISPPCTVSCNSKDGKNSGSGGGGGNSLGLVVGILLLFIIIGGGVGGFFFYRRRRNSNDEEDDDDNNDKKKKKKKNIGKFLFGRSLGNDNNTLSTNGSDDENAREIDKEDDNDQKRNKKDKKKKTKKNKKNQLDDCSTDIEEGLSSDDDDV